MTSFAFNPNLQMLLLSFSLSAPLLLGGGGPHAIDFACKEELLQLLLLISSQQMESLVSLLFWSQICTGIDPLRYRTLTSEQYPYASFTSS